MDERNPLPGRITHRLNLDSEEEQQREEQERLEREEYEREKEEKRKRKQQKRRAKEEEERAMKQEAERKIEQKKKEIERYNDPATLFQPDSDSGVSFSRIKRKIEEMYPKFSRRARDEPSESVQSEEEESQSEEDQSEEDSESDSEENSSRKRKQKKTKKIEKKRKNESDSQERNTRKKVKQSTKVEPEMSAKDKLVQEVAIRWHYGLPEWPPLDYDYEGELRKRGYRAVEFSKFKFVDEIVDGLVKVYELDGYKGVYRGKFGLIDVRPKDQCPSLNYFYSKSDEELNAILKRALTKQLQQLQSVQFKQSGEEKLLEDLKRRVKDLSR